MFPGIFFSAKSKAFSTTFSITFLYTTENGVFYKHLVEIQIDLVSLFRNTLLWSEELGDWLRLYFSYWFLRRSVWTKKKSLDFRLVEEVGSFIQEIYCTAVGMRSRSLQQTANKNYWITATVQWNFKTAASLLQIHCYYRKTLRSEPSYYIWEVKQPFRSEILFFYLLNHVKIVKFPYIVPHITSNRINETCSYHR